MKKISKSKMIKLGSVTLAVTGTLIATNSNAYDHVGVFFVGIGMGLFILSFLLPKDKVKKVVSN